MFEHCKELAVTEFKGLYARGKDKAIPLDHAQVCQNIMFNPHELRCRDPLFYSYTLGHTNTIRTFSATGFTPGGVQYNNFLTMDAAGNLYKDADAVPLLATAGTDFTAINLYGRTYIAIVNAIAPVNLKVWNGVYLRDAAGAAVPTQPTVADSASAGNIVIGIHYIAVSFLTDTGYTTVPCAIKSWTAAGGKKVSITNIPIGPTGTVGRIVFASKLADPTMYYVAGGTINDNVTTTLTLDFLDTNLIVSADSLYDQLTSIPAGNGLDFYHGRLVSFGIEKDLIRVSGVGTPESFDSVTGFIQLPTQGDNNTVKGSTIFLDQLYFTKFPGIWLATDNGGDPTTWPTIIMDGAIGAYSSGISKLKSNQPNYNTMNACIMAYKTGLYMFNGTTQYPELSWKIRDIWININANCWPFVTVITDIENSLIYVLLDVDGSSTPTQMLVADFSEGLDYKNIKWTYWNSQASTFAAIAMASLPSDPTNVVLRVCGSANKVFYFDPNPTTIPTPGDAYGTQIISRYRTGYFNAGVLNSFQGLRLENAGTGNTGIRVASPQNAAPTQLTEIDNTFSSDTKDIIRVIKMLDIDGVPMAIGILCEDLAVEVYNLNLPGSIIDQIYIQKIAVFAKPMFETRPGGIL